MPRTAKFNYDYRKGSPWPYETLISQFDFPILKTEEQIRDERGQSAFIVIPYYKYSEDAVSQAVKNVQSLDLGVYKNIRPAVVTRLEDIYAKGIIVSISDIDTTGSFGNATYLISDYADGSTGTFQVYRGYGLNGEKFNKPGATIIKVGDAVLIKGKVVNYKGNTPQFAQGSTIVTIQ